MRYIIILLFWLSLLFPLSMKIDSSMIKDSVHSFKWSLIPIVSQGQMYNQKYLKSMFFMYSQSYCLSQVYYHDQFSETSDIKNRNKYAWWFLGLYVSSMIDSYIDAELSTFPKRIK